MEENFENGIVCRNGESVQALDTITSTVEDHSQGVKEIVAETTPPEPSVPELRNLPKIESVEALFEMDIFDLEALYCQYFPDFESYIFRFYKRRKMQTDLGIIEVEKFKAEIEEAFNNARIFFIANLGRDYSEFTRRKMRNKISEKGLSESKFDTYYAKTVLSTKNARNLNDALKSDVLNENFSYILGARIATFTQATVNSPKSITNFESERPEIISNLEAAFSEVRGEKVEGIIVRGNRKKVESHEVETSWRLHFETKAYKSIPLDHVDLESENSVVLFLKAIFEWRGRFDEKSNFFIFGEKWADSLKNDFIRVCASVGIYGALKPRGVIISNITSLERILELSIITEENREETFRALKAHSSQPRTKNQDVPIEYYLDYHRRRLKEPEKKAADWCLEYGVGKDVISNWLNKKKLPVTIKGYVEYVETPDPVWEERVVIGKGLRLARQINNSEKVELTKENHQFFMEHAHRILENQEAELKLNWLAEIEMKMAIKFFQNSQELDSKLKRCFTDPHLVIPDFPIMRTKASVMFNKSYFESLILWMVGEYYSNLNVDLSEIESVALEALEKILPNMDPSLPGAMSPWKIAEEEAREAINLFTAKEALKNS